MQERLAAQTNNLWYVRCTIIIVTAFCYRPHPKDDGRLCFHFVHHCGGGGTPYTDGGRVSPFRSRLGGLPHPLTGGTPFPGLRRGYPIHWIGGYPLPSSRWGGGGYPIHWWRGIPFPGPGRGCPPSRSRQGGTRVTPPTWTWTGGGVYPDRSRIACTCYAAGGVPLAFTQEDFIVSNSFSTQTLNLIL